MNPIEHCNAIVTGASSGIGQAIALGLAGPSVRLSLVGRGAERLQNVATAAQQKGANVRCHRADLAADAELDGLAAGLAAEGPVHVLVHAAGALSWGPLQEASTIDLDRQYRINVRAPFVLTQRLLPQLRSCRGQVLFVNSTAGLAAGANVGPYAATKHALKALADSLREEVNPDGVRVLSLFLGRTASPMQADVHAREGRPYRPELLMQPDDVAWVALQALAAPRSVEITEIRMRPMVKSY
ncbi:SDR family NAD(P)-dependent oxidoreductase [Ramlibacter sp. MMS24-I3-19]|uniref:SDR family NAD(P)-dependent oxidoreductase n=1 Tax=Ramlibacter sp. MMS24-I3-19 TaxID=3416606 RepID=UPI003D0832E1